MPLKRKSAKPPGKPKPKSRAKPTRKKPAGVKQDPNAPILSWAIDLVMGGPFDLPRPPSTKIRALRQLFVKAAKGEIGSHEKLREAVGKEGDNLLLGAGESDLGSLVRYWAQHKPDSWRALPPLVASDEHYHAAMAARALIMSHPDGIVAGAREVAAVVGRRFDYMNLSDQSDLNLKQMAAATMLRGILLMGDVQLAGVARQIARHLPRDFVVAAAATGDGDGREEFNMPPSLLLVEFVLGCAENEAPDTDEYVEWLLYLSAMPKAHKGKPCLEIYEYPRGRIAPFLSFISYSEWVDQNESRIRDISCREPGRHDDTGAGIIFGSWSEVTRLKPSQKQLALQAIYQNAERVAIRADKTPPLDW